MYIKISFIPMNENKSLLTFLDTGSVSEGRLPVFTGEVVENI